MRAILAFAAVSAIFVAINVIGAGVIFGLYRLVQVAAPSLADSPLVMYPLGILGLAAALCLSFLVLRFIERQPWHRVRGRA